MINLLRSGVVFSCLLLFIGPAAAQAPAAAPAPTPAARAPHRVLFLVLSSDYPHILSAVAHANQLRKSGIDTMVVFEGRQSVLAFSDLLGLMTPDKVAKIRDEDKDKKFSDQRLPKKWQPSPPSPRNQLLRQLVSDAVNLGVSIQVDMVSASYLGVLDDLRAANVPVIGIPDKLFNLAPLVSKGYQIVTF